MFEEKYNAVYALEIAEYLNYNLNGENIEIHSFKNIDNIEDNSVICLLKTHNYFEILKEIEKNNKDILIITDIEEPEVINFKKISYICTHSPFEDFLKIVKQFFADKKEFVGILSKETINKNSILGSNIFIGYNVVIDENVIINDDTKIMHNTIITGKT
ncbi:MAG TPA: hypothetical protein PLJ38_07420, partial [bacterium]|nr:hypothetical protein [bacterium]